MLMPRRSAELGTNAPEAPAEMPKAKTKGRANRESTPKAPAYQEDQLVQLTEKDRDITARVDSVNKKDGSYRLRVEGSDKDEFITRSGEELTAGEERAKRMDVAEKSYAKLAKAIAERNGNAGLAKSLKENKAAYLRDAATGDEKDVGKSLGERVELAAFAAEVKPKHKESLRAHLDLLDAVERKNAEILALGKKAKADPENFQLGEDLLNAKLDWQELTKASGQQAEALRRAGLDVGGARLDRKANRDTLREDATIEGDPATLAHLVKPEHKESLDAYLELLDATERESADVRSLSRRVKADPENASLAKELAFAKRDWDTLAKSAGRYRDTLIQNGLDISTYRLDRKADRDVLRTSLDELAKPPRMAEADKPMAFEDYDTPAAPVDGMAQAIRESIKLFDTEKLSPADKNALDAKILQWTAEWAAEYLRTSPSASAREVLDLAEKEGLSEFLTFNNVRDLKKGVPVDEIHKTDVNELLARAERRDAKGRVLRSETDIDQDTIENLSLNRPWESTDTLSLGTDSNAFEGGLPIPEFPREKRPSVGAEPTLPFERSATPFGKLTEPQLPDETRYNNFDSPAQRAETLWRTPNTEVARPEPQPQPRGLLQRMAQSRLGKWGKRAVLLALGILGAETATGSRLGSEDAAPSREQITMAAPESTVIAATEEMEVEQNDALLRSEPVARASVRDAGSPAQKARVERPATREMARSQAHIRELTEWVRNGSITENQFAEQMTDQERAQALKQSVRFDAKEALKRNKQIARDVRKGLKNADWVVAHSGASTETATSAPRTERPAALQAILDRQAREKAEMESLGTFEEPEE